MQEEQTTNTNSDDIKNQQYQTTINIASNSKVIEIASTILLNCVDLDFLIKLIEVVPPESKEEINYKAMVLTKDFIFQLKQLIAENK